MHGAGSVTDDFEIGIARRPITPTVRGRKVVMAGYGVHRLATDIHDELWVRAVAMRYRDTLLVLVSLDLLGLSREDIATIQQLAVGRGVPADSVLVTCTRNHAGPDTLGLARRSVLGIRPNVRYLEFLLDEIAQVSRLALDALQPAEAHLACRQVSGAAGLPDGELVVLEFKDASGWPLATLVNFPLVPKVVGRANLAIGTDFLYWLYQELEHGRNEVVVYVCAEAPTACPARSEGLSTAALSAWQVAEQAGRGLAAEVREALRDVSPVPVERLVLSSKTISVQRNGAAEHRSLPSLRRQRGKEVIESRVGVIELGPVRLAVLPGVVAPDLGFEIRKILDAPYRALLCASNDCLDVVASRGIGLQDGWAPPGSRVGTVVLDEIANMMVEIRSRSL
jgi:hypothetical protein